MEIDVPRFASTTGAARAVGVVFDIIGQTVVDDVGEFVDIESTSRNVGSHKELGAVLAKLLHRQVALGLCQITVQRFCAITIFDELVGNLLGFEACAAEDDAIDARIVVDNALESCIFVFVP